ncbi:hypothetical protein PG990_009806 [Apiospora arundinis]|uniref:MARVEL domain-containing protein n=1 Tax=Apiospora arundinis TaxID=335852 RepID=A0ABR2IUB4_9PEZI
MAIRGLMAPGVPPQPKWLIFIKGAIILLAVIVLALAAYALSLFGDYSYYYSAGAPGYLLFVTIFSMIVYGTAIFLELKAQQFYYRIAMLVVYIMTCIFWLSSWAWAASWASFLLAYYNSSYYPGFRSFGSAMAACAALGAVTWVLCIINLVFFIVGSVRNHDPAANPGNVELGHAGQKPADAGHTPVYAQNQTAQPTSVPPQQAY